jgi:pyruvate kinase
MPGIITAMNTPKPAGDARCTMTKIVATIGPASQSHETVRRLIEAGVSIFRFNFSHGTFEDHARRLAVVREVSAEMERPIAALGDLQGPKIRVGKVPETAGSCSSPGQDVVFRRGVAMAFSATPRRLVNPARGLRDDVRAAHR